MCCSASKFLLFLFYSHFLVSCMLEFNSTCHVSLSWDYYQLCSHLFPFPSLPVVCIRAFQQPFSLFKDRNNRCCHSVWLPLHRKLYDVRHHLDDAFTRSNKLRLILLYFNSAIASFHAHASIKTLYSSGLPSNISTSHTGKAINESCCDVILFLVCIENAFRCFFFDLQLHKLH